MSVAGPLTTLAPTQVTDRSRPYEDTLSTIASEWCRRRNQRSSATDRGSATQSHIAPSATPAATGTSSPSVQPSWASASAAPTHLTHDAGGEAPTSPSEPEMTTSNGPTVGSPPGSDDDDLNRPGAMRLLFDTYYDYYKASRKLKDSGVIHVPSHTFEVSCHMSDTMEELNNFGNLGTAVKRSLLAAGDDKFSKEFREELWSKAEEFASKAQDNAGFSINDDCMLGTRGFSVEAVAGVLYLESLYQEDMYGGKEGGKELKTYTYEDGSGDHAVTQGSSGWSLESHQAPRSESCVSI